MKDPLHFNFTHWLWEKNSLQSRVWSIFQLKNFPLTLSNLNYSCGAMQVFWKKFALTSWEMPTRWARSTETFCLTAIRVLFERRPDQNVLCSPFCCDSSSFLPEKHPQFFLFKERDCGVWRKRESFVRVSNWTAFVCPIFFACTAARQARISALPMSEHWSWNPCPSHDHPRPFQILHRKAVTAIRGLF